MAKEWTDEEVQKEISEAVQIVRADKIDALIRSRLSAKPNPEDGDKGNPPPSGDGDNPPPGNKKKSLWWGTEELSTATNKAAKASQRKGIRMPLRRHKDDRERRLIEPGDEYTIIEEKEIELWEVIARLEPDINVQGEPWEWTKEGDRPIGWPGPDDNPDWHNRNDPGPFNGEWERPREDMD